MTSTPFMQLYVSDYLGDTRALTTEQHGAYLLLLMTMWNAGGSLPNDPAKLARFTGCTLSRWAKISPDVMLYFENHGDTITNARLSKEVQKAEEKSAKRSEAGSRGGSAKALKDKEPKVAIATVLPEQNSGIYQIPEPEIGRTGTNVPVARERADPTKRKATKRCPETWEPSPEIIAVGITEGLVPGEIDRELAKIRDYQFATAHSDWDATFRNWLRKAAETKARQNVHRTDPSAKRTARESNYDRAFRAPAISLDLARL